MLIAHEIAKQLIHALAPLLPLIGRHDQDLLKQLRRAASSVLFNVGEGNRRRKGDRQHLFDVAAGSAAEVRDALTVAIAWSYVTEEAASHALALADRELGLLWGLTHARR